MTELQTVKPNELQTANELRKRFADLTYEYGQLAWAQRALNREKSAIEKQFDKLSDEETEFIEELNKKYGVGTLNVETGAFTPVETK